MNETPKTPEVATKLYEKPKIAWEEEYTPTAFGVSCAMQPGNPGCNPGPTTS
jgi:hypothetical protein